MAKWRVLPVALAGVVLSFVGLASGQQIMLQSCADVRVEDYGKGASSYQPVLCRSEFSVTDPYLVLFGQVGPISRDVRVAIDLVDPDGASAYHRATAFEPNPAVYTRYTLALLLPLAINAVEAWKKVPYAIPIFLGRPASGRLGVWTWKLALDSGPSAETKFTLKP